MHAPNPLRSLFDVFGRSPESHVDGVNRRSFEQLVDLLDVDPALRGRCILLRAPRAGYGKTHLLSLAARHFGVRHEFVLLTLADGSRMHPGSVLEDLLRRLCRPLPAAGGLTELDLVARRVLAMGLEPLVRSGEVPCQDRESAVVALRERATETFDFHHPNAVTAHWARDNFGVLGPRLGLELSQKVCAPLRESVGWVEALYRFAATPVDQPARIGALIEAAGGGASLDRLGALLQMLTALRRVVLVVDEIEGLSADPESALRLAAFITSLRQTAESVDVVIALNRDLWDSAFRPRLSGGLEDRLAEWVIELQPLSEAEMEALIDSRVPGRGAELVPRIDLDDEDRYARNVLRRASELWEKDISKEPVIPSVEPPLVQEAPKAPVAPRVESVPPTEVAAATTPFADLLDDQPIVPAAQDSEPVIEPLAEPLAEAAIEPVIDPVIKAPAEPVIETADEPVAEPIAEAAIEPIIEAPAEPVIEAADEPVIEAADEPVAEPVAEPLAEPLAEAAIEPVIDPVIEAPAEPVIEAVDEPVIKPADEPVIKPADEPVIEPADEPVIEAKEDVHRSFGMAAEQQAGKENEPPPLPRAMGRGEDAGSDDEIGKPEKADEEPRDLGSALPAAWEIPGPPPASSPVAEALSPFVGVREGASRPGADSEKAAEGPAEPGKVKENPEAAAGRVGGPWGDFGKAPEERGHADESRAPAGQQAPEPPAAGEASQTESGGEEPARATAAPAPQEVLPPAPAEDGAESDRVDELLRQFRERYGRR